MFACSRHWECVEMEPSIHHHHQTHTHTHTGTCLHTHTHSFGSQSGFFFSPGLQGGAEPKVNISRVEAKWRSCGGSNHRHVKQTPAAQVETRGLSGPREGALSLRISALSDGSWSCDSLFEGSDVWRNDLQTKCSDPNELLNVLIVSLHIFSAPLKSIKSGCSCTFVSHE